MFSRIARPLLVLSWSCVLSTVLAQNTPLGFTSGVTNPAPVPGQPFLITWHGGTPDEAVYIILNYLFPDTPNQNIVYGTTDILSNAPNNGSWTYNVPANIFQGRYTFSIGENPFLLSDQTGVFTILPSQTSAVTASPAPATSNTLYQSYNGCGLPPLPDYTYTGYQNPCTVTSNGQVETLYPIVPVTDSSLFFGTSYLATPTTIGIASEASSSSSTSLNPAFATGVIAQALQCPTQITPTATTITASGTTTIFSEVACATTTSGAAVTTTGGDGVCHTSGYSTFSVSGTGSVCCPNGWDTTTLSSPVIFCYTSTTNGNERRDVLVARHASTETLVSSPSTLIVIEGLAFTTAGVVKNEAVTGSNSKTISSGSVARSSASSTSTLTTRAEGGGSKLEMSVWRIELVLVAVAIAGLH